MLEHVSDSEGLANQGAKFLKNRALAVGLKIDLAALDGSGEDSGPRKALQVPLDRSGAQANSLNHSPLVESLIRMPEEQGKHALPRFTEKRFPEQVFGGSPFGTHIGYDYTQCGYHTAR